MIPVKFLANASTAKPNGTTPLFCRKCGKVILIARRPGKGANNILELCGRCRSR